MQSEKIHIWVVTWHIEHLYIFCFLQKYDFSYSVFYDQEWGDWFDKPLVYTVQRASHMLDAACSHGVTHVILPPLLELHFLQDESLNKKYWSIIMPLYTTYVLQYCLPYSLVGKIWCVWDWLDENQQMLWKNLCAKHILTPKQKEINIFQQPLQFWSKKVSLRKHFLVSLGRKDWMMHNVVKHDLRYFCDAWVDTLLPLHYGYFAYDVTIAKFFRTKKIRWHRLEQVEKSFCDLIDDVKNAGKYQVSVHYTGTIDHLLQEKKRVWLLQRGKQIQIDMYHITL